jgi:hypothetical protein
MRRYPLSAVRDPRSATNLNQEEHVAERHEWRAGFTFAGASTLTGVGIAYLTSRGLGADDVGVLVVALVASGALLGMLAPRWCWVWGMLIYVGMAAGNMVWPSAPIPMDHPPSRPLWLPMGLSGSSLAQWLAGSALIFAFPVVGAVAGAMVRLRVVPALDRLWRMA